jgi:hypothetical protein
MRGDKQGTGFWPMSAVNGSGLKPKRSRARVTAARQISSASGCDDASADAASGSQGLELREGATAEDGTWVRRRTSAACLRITNERKQNLLRQHQQRERDCSKVVCMHSPSAFARKVPIQKKKKI